MAESMHGFDLVRLQITIVRHQIHGVVRQESRALTNQPSVQLVPVRSRWSFTPVYHCNFVVMSIRFSCLLMGVSKSPVLFNRYIQPVLSRNALVLFKCVKQIQEANCRVLRVPGLHNLFPGKQRHLTVQFLCSWFGCKGYKGGGMGRCWESWHVSGQKTQALLSVPKHKVKEKKEFPNQDQQKQKAARTNPKQTKGGREKVLKNLTRLWPGSSSTLTGNKRNKTNPTQEIKQDSTNEAAPKAVREWSAIRGGRSGTRKAGSPDSLQSENPGTREKRKTEREKEGAEHKDESKNKRGEERANQKEGGWREALVTLARL